MAVTLERTPQPDIASLSPRDIIQRGLEVERLETIQIAGILSEHAIIDVEHAADLGASMKQKRKQITPIAVRAREEEGRVVYDILDGFHRTEGKRMTGETDINATVIYGCSDEEMYDLRILAASSVRSVQFARIAHWMTMSYEETPWAKTGLTVAQAFGIAVNDVSRSYNAKLDKNEIEQLKEWAKAKCARWRQALSSAYQILKTVAIADPDLVQKVRTATGGHSGKTEITQGKLSYVANAFPGEEFYPTQRVILEYGLEQRLEKDKVAIIVDALKGKVQPDTPDDQIKELVIAVNLDSAPERKITVATLLDEFTKSEVARARLALEHAALVNGHNGHVAATEGNVDYKKLGKELFNKADPDRMSIILKTVFNIADNELSQILNPTPQIQKAPEMPSRTSATLFPKPETNVPEPAVQQKEFPRWVDDAAYTVLISTATGRLRDLDKKISTPFLQAFNNLSPEEKKAIQLPDDRRELNSYILNSILDRIQYAWDDPSRQIGDGRYGHMIRYCRALQERGIKMERVARAICDHYQMPLPPEFSNKPVKQ